MGPPVTLCLSLVELGQTLTASPTAMWGCCVRLCSVAWLWLLSEGIAAHPTKPLTLEVQGAAPGSRMQAGGRCQGPAVQGAEPQQLSHPLRNCPCPGLSLLPPASFLRVCTFCSLPDF